MGVLDALRVAFTAVCLAIHGATARTDSWRVDQFTTDDGLPSNTIQALAPTPDGFLWIGTLNGLVRYDGLEFVTVDLPAGPVPNASSVISLAVRGDGRLYVGLNKGLLVQEATGFRRITSPALGPAAGPQILVALGDQLLVGGKWQLAAGPPERLKGVDHFVEPRAALLGPDRAVWVSHLHGIDRWALPLEANIPQRMASGAPSAALAFHGNRLWGVMGPDVLEWDLTTTQLTRRWPDLAAFYLMADSRGGLWMSDHLPRGRPAGGLLRWEDGKEERFLENVALAPEELLAVLEDRSGVVWVATRGQGLWRLRPKAMKVHAARSGLPHEDVWSISASPDGGLWASTRLGPARWTGERFTTIPGDYRNQRERPIWALSATEALWADRGGILRLTPTGSSDELLTPNTTLRFFTAAPHGGVHAGGRGGVWHRDKAGNWTEEPGLPPDTTWLHWSDGPGGEVYLGSLDRGLYHRPPGASWEKVGLEGNPTAAAVLWWQGGIPWVGSIQGLYRRRPDGGWDHWTTQHGLLENMVFGIQPDAEGGLWLFGHQGICRVELAKLEAVAQGRLERVWPRVLGQAEGLASSEGNGGAFPAQVMDSSGHLWFPTIHGAVRFHPGQLEQPVPPLPLLTEVREVAANRPVDFSRGPGRFAGGEGRHLQFRFTAPAPSDAPRIRLEYQLAGVDAGWQRADRRREASYAGLRPGRHRFELRAAASDGTWHPTVARWDFEVVPLWWERSVIREGAVVVLIGGVLVAALRRLRRQQELARLRQAEAVEAERRRLARDMHDGLGSELARVSLAAATGPVDAGAMSRALMDRLQTLVWLTDPGEDRLDSLARTLANRVERFFPDGQPHVELVLPSVLPREPVPGAWRRELVAWLDEGLANIARHARARRVRFTLHLGDGELRLGLADDGQGFDPARIRPGARGLANQKDRLAGLGGRCEIRTGLGQGTELEAHLPWKPEPHRHAIDPRAPANLEAPR